MLPADRERVISSDTSAAALAEHGTDEFAIPPDDDGGELDEGIASGPEAADGADAGDERQWFGKHPAYPRNAPVHLHTPDLQTRFYVGLWLPGAGALLAYGVLRGNYWAAFVGIELLLVGWFTLAKL